MLRAIERNRDALDRIIRTAPPANFTARRDARGWTAKDHIAHVAVWERSLVALLSGRPRHRALGVSEEVLRSGELDEVNAVIHAAHRDRPLALILSEYQEVHEQAMAVLRRLTDEELRRPYSHFQAGPPLAGADLPAHTYVSAETADHFDEHASAIAELLA